MESGTRIAFLGGGNMARALIGGLLAAGHSPGALSVFDSDPEKAALLQREHDITVTAGAAQLLDSDALVLAVKPQHMEQAARGLALDGTARAPLLVSVAAGVPLVALGRWLPEPVSIVRCMPNTPALVGAGTSVLCANARVSQTQRLLAAAILAAVGTVHWVEDESLMDAVTAVSGSGPAYFFLFQELLQESAIRAGLAPELAAQLVTQTALGAARLAAQDSAPVARLRAQVTSPGGTTERALQEFTTGGLAQLVDKAVLAARDRSEELARELDKSS